MKVNSISTVQYNTQANRYTNSFKHYAVPYPEYENGYNNNRSFQSKVNNIFNRISDLFHPVVSQEAEQIKSQIDTYYSKNNNQKPQMKNNLLQVLA